MNSITENLDLQAGPVSFAATMAVGTTQKTEVCATHGSFSSRNLFRSVWSGCPQCAANEKAIKQREEAEKEAQDRHLRWQRKLGEAGIPERFKNRSLACYTASGEGQKRALEFATNYADQFGEVLKTGRGAIFCGKPGTGKTHLSIGIALAVMERGGSAMFTTVQRMILRVKDSWRKNSEESESDVLNMLVYPDMLIIDEIGVQFGSEFEKNFMFLLLNERYEKRRPTILLSNLTAAEVKAFLGERIYDRLREDGGQCVSFDWASHRGRA